MVPGYNQNFMRDGSGQIIIGVKGQSINVESNTSTQYPNFFNRPLMNQSDVKCKFGDYNGLSTRSATTLDLNVPSYNRNMHVSLSAATSSIDFNTEKMRASQQNFLAVPVPATTTTFLQKDFSKTKIQMKK